MSTDTKPTNTHLLTIDDLLEKFDQEDEAYDEEERQADAEAEEDLTPESASIANEEEEKRVKEVMDACRNPRTKHSYWLHQRRFIAWLFLKAKFNKTNKGKYRVILHPEVYQSLSLVSDSDDNNKKKKLLFQVSMEHAKRASEEYHPVMLERLPATVFLEFLLALNDDGEFFKSYGGLRSSLTFLFTQCRVTPSKEFIQDLKVGMTGLKNKSAMARGEQGCKLGEGKEPLPFEVYRAICRWLIEDGSTESIFSHLFLCLTWNLMCRSKNTVKIHKNHISWSSDAMAIRFAHSKTDKMGKNGGWKRHIFANPFMPEICPILSYSIFRQTFPGVDDGKLFNGNSPYDRFRKCLKKVLDSHKDEVLRLGVNPDNIGVHSIRKGAATYSTSGTTAGVNFVAVCVRAGWSMGFKDTYLQYSEAGDQLCGRTVAGLDVNSHLFAISPPFFYVRKERNNTESEAGTEVSSDEDVDQGIELVFGQVEPDRRLLCRYLLSSLLHHRDWLCERKENTNRLFGSIVFRPNEILDKLTRCVQVCLPWTNVDDSLWRITFTGISPVVRSFCYQQQQLELVTQLPTDVLGKIRHLLDNRGIAGGNISLDELRETLLEPLSKKIDTLAKNGIDKKEDEEGEVKRMATFSTIPSNYKLNPTLSTLAVWLNWHHGEIIDMKRGLRSPPWKALESRDMARKSPTQERNTARKMLSNLRFLCGAFDQVAKYGETSRPTEEELTKIFHDKKSPVAALLHSLCTTEKGRTRRVEECHWETLAKACRKNLKNGPEKEIQRKNPQQGNGKRNQPKKRNQPINHERKTKKPRKSKRKHVPSSKAAASPALALGLRGTFAANFPLTEDMVVSGPHPRSPNVGRALLEPQDYKRVMQQGLMMCGFETTAYLSRLSRANYNLGVRRVEEDFWTRMGENLTQHGIANFWEIHMQQMNRRALGSNFIDWQNDPVIIIPIFLGPREAGHWTLLICDRTRSKTGVMVYFDSLPAYQKDIFEKLQEVLQHTSLVKEGTKWIRATMRNQAIGSNDCGMWMCCSASVYVKGLKDRGWLVEGGLKEKVPEITSVTLMYPMAKEMDEIGWRGRTHMICTYQDNKCDLENPFFNFVRVWFN